MKRFFLSVVLFMCIKFVLAQVYVYQDFEEGLGQWQTVAMTTNNESNFGIVTNASAAHWGNSYFQFSSYNVSSDYNQYLITPRLDLTKTAILEYYYKDISGHGRETFTIMISTTDNEMSSFTTVSNTITATDSWL